MAKPPKKVKEPVRLRFKELADGSRSIYLDIYKNGKRHYEFLKLYLIPATNPLQKQINADTLNAANAIKAQRIIELANDEAGIMNTHRGKMLLIDWLQEIREQKEDKSEGWKRRIEYIITLVKEYEGEKTRLCDVDKDYCAGFIHYLTNVYTTKTGNHIGMATVQNYYRVFNCALNEAVRAGLISHNPTMMISRTDKIKVPESTRTYLTIDEVKTLIKTPCKCEIIKQAYLFSVYCGLRWSDIERLRWGDIVDDGGQVRVSLVQKKTKNSLYLPLSKQALRWLPDRTDKTDNDTVFALPTKMTASRTMKEWAATAGITKNVTFHTARHTFATMMLTLGADLYTTSKLLGHTEIGTTQIYAKIIDKKKDEAVNLVNDIFND